MALNKKIVAGGAVALLVGALVAGFSGSAKAEEPPPDLPPDVPPPDLPPDQPPPDLPPIPSEPAPGNVNTEEGWGVVPAEWRSRYAAAENAAGIPGAAQAFATIAWRAWRAGQAPVTLAQAAELAKDPDWCRFCHNISKSERDASKSALDRVITPKALGGAYQPPWPTPADVVGWGGGVAGEPSKGGGSVGLFDILLGSHCHDGIHDGYTPLVNMPWNVMYTWQAQFYVAGWIIFRCIHREDLPVLGPNSLETYANIGACWATPQGFKEWKAGQASAWATKAATAYQNFKIRAAELGIDFSKVKNPDPKTWGWKGPKMYWQALAAAGLADAGGDQQPGNVPPGLTADEKLAVETVAAERPTSTDLVPAPYNKQRVDVGQTERQFLTNVAFWRVYIPKGAPPGPLEVGSAFVPAYQRMDAYMKTLPLGNQQPVA